jgi:chemosensory pili system protein ChpA (sensor histidine kinase/response regulator)
MKAEYRLENSTLNWVKNELDAILGQTRQALELYLEDASDESLLQEMQGLLHQVDGTLQMVELHGASMLAREMEELVQALTKGEVKKRDDAFEVLSRAILQFPDYLEHLQAGNRDVPLVLLPLLNDIRTARNAELLSEKVLFIPELESVTAPPNRSVASEPSQTDAPELAKRLRHNFQLGLLGWFRGKDERASLTKLMTVSMRLQRAASSDAARRLWWLASALAEALAVGGLEASMTVKSLFGKLDREIKRLIEQRDGSFDSAIPQDLIKNILYYIASAQDRGDLVKAVKRSFALNDILPKGSDLDEMRDRISGPNADLLNTVSQAIREDLADIKDSLEIFVTGADKRPEELEPLISKLLKVGDTLGMLGLGGPRAEVLREIEIVKGIVTGEQAATDAVLMNVAGVMLNVEAAIDRFIATRAARPASQGESEPQEPQTLPEVEYRRLMESVVAEVLSEMARAKEAILAFIAAPKNHDTLGEVPRYLEHIKGALAMSRVSELPLILDALGGYVSTRILGDGVVPDFSELESLADAITSVEYYLESMGSASADLESILDTGRSSVAKLGFPISGQDNSPALEPAPESIPGPAEAGRPAEPERLVQALEETSDAVEATAEALASGAQVPDSGAPTPQAGVARDLVPLAGEADEEILEIFLEEVEEEIETLSQLLPRWQRDLSDEESLSTMRRSFHTLKGSGRLVGAQVIGEFGWAFEHLLNQLLEGSLSATDAHPRVLAEALEALPQLVQQIKDGRAPDIDPFALMDKAQVLSRGEQLGPEADKKKTPEPDSRPDDHATACESLEAPAEETEGAVEQGSDPMAESTAQWAASELPQLSGDTVQFQTEVDRTALFPAQDETAEAEVPAAALTQPQETVGEGPVADHPGPAQPETQAIEPPGRRKGVDRDGACVGEGMDGRDGPAGDDTGEQGPRHPDTAGQEPCEAAAVDPDLLDIFIEEAREHLQTLEQSLGAGQRGEDGLSADLELIRALHTLSGSARMASVPEVADLCAPLERYATRRNEAKRPVPPEALAVFEDATGLVGRILQALQDDAALPDISPLLTRIEPLSQPDAGAPREGPRESEPEPEFEQGPKQQSETDPESEPELEQGPEPEPEPLQAPAPGVESLPQSLVDAPAEAGSPSEAAQGPDADTPASGVCEDAPEERLDPGDGGEATQEGIDVEVQGATDDEGLVPDLPGEQDPDLLEIFLEEAGDILDSCDHTLQLWIAAPQDQQAVLELQRQLHTLKGGARMAGLGSIGDLSHALESLIIAVADGRVADASGLFDHLNGVFDRLQGMIELAEKGQAVYPAPRLIQVLERLRAGESVPTQRPADGPQGEPQTVSPKDDHVAPTAGEDAPQETCGSRPDPAAPRPQTPVQEPPKTAETPSEGQPAGGRGGAQEQIRVRAELLDNLVNHAGEVNIYHARLQQQISAFGFNLGELDQTVLRLQNQLRKLEGETEAQILFRYEQEKEDLSKEFDPLELDRYSTIQQLSRALGESVSDLTSIKDMLAELVRDSETLLLQQSRVSTDLQEGLMHTRMVQFSSMAPRLRRIARQTANELGKRVELQIRGESNELDRSVLEAMVPPLEHMLRNAISHGIESGQERKAAGKLEQGRIRIGLEREGSEVVIRVEDDGAGLNLEAIRHKAERVGLIRKDESVSPNELMQFILESGFSTAKQVTQISGRGVGMDVVNSEIKQLGGVLSIDSAERAGTSFTVRLPFTLAINQALLVVSGEDLYAVPLASIEGIVRLTADELKTSHELSDPVYSYAANEYRLKHLGVLLGASKPRFDDPHMMYPVLLVRSGELRVAIQVDALMGNREIVVKPVGPQIGKLKGISGATILGDGRVVLILDVAGLVRMGAGTRAVSTVHRRPGESTQMAAVTVMVVDDSITIRKVTTRLLERNNFRVITAKDGVDAVSQLQEHQPDLMLLDIEMPRMDGFELATHMRNTFQLKGIPIIMITSRTGDKHRQRALEIGVNRYLGKPYQESELLENITAVLASRSV